MTSKDIAKYYEVMQTKQRCLKKFASYAYGENYGIKTADSVAKPDNRIPVPLAKSAITDIVGYTGRPGEIVTEYVREDGEEDQVTELLESFDKYNNEGIENSELLTASLSLGIAWELWWTSDELDLPNAMLTPEYKIISNFEAVPVWTNDIKPKMKKFIRFWCDGHGQDKIEYADIYMPLKWERWINSDGVWGLTIPLDSDGNKISMIHPYNRVPVIPYRTSMSNTPVFASQIDLIDAYDSIVSKTQNEIDRFNALIALFPGDIDKEFIAKLTDAAKPYIDNLEMYDPGKWPQYLNKEFGGVTEFYKSHADRIKEDFYNTIKVPNFMDEGFAGNAQSGVAIAYKLIGFEFLVSEIEIYFRTGLQQRFDFYADILELSTIPFNREDYRQEIIWNRNLPVDDEAKVRIASMLKGLGYDNIAIQRYIPDAITNAELEEEEEELIDLPKPPITG